MDNNTKRSYVVDVNDKGSLDRIASDLKKNKKLLDDVRKSAKAYERVLQDLGFGTNGKQQIAANRLKSTGGASTAATNAVASGEINKINASTAAIRVQEKRVASLRQGYKSLGTEITLAMSKLKRKDFAALKALDSTQAKELVGASQARVGAARLNTLRAPNNKNYQKQLAAEQALLLKNEKSLERIVMQEKQRSVLAKKANTLRERIATIDAKIAKQAQLINRYRQLGENSSARAAINKTRELKLQKLNLNTDKLTSKELALHVALTNKRNASLARTKLANQNAKDPLESLNNRLKDGGAGLFKVQAQLLANYAAMGAALAAIGFAGRFIVDLDNEFKQLQAITATTDTNMQGLKNTLISVSEETKFTALDIAQAATILGQAGFSISQIEASISPIAKLATAVGTDLNTAVDLVTSTITVFNLRAEETATVANVFTAAVNNSKLNLEKLTLGIQYSGNIAAEQNIEFTELTATLGAMANSGIRAGSTLGTGLRQVLTSLAAPSAKLEKRFRELGLSSDDTDVKLSGLTGVLNNLKEAGFTTSDALEYMEVRAGAAFAAMSNNVETIGQLQTQFLLSNAAAEANATQMESLANKGARLKSVFGTLVSNGANPLTEVLKEMLDGLTLVLQVFNSMGPVIPILTAAIVALTVAVIAKRAAVFASNLVFKDMIVKYKAATAATVVQTGATRGLALATKGLWAALGPIGVAILAITTGMAAYKYITDKTTVSMDELEAATERAEGRTDSYRQNIKAIDKEIDRLTQRMGSLKDGSVEVNNIGIELTEKFRDLGASFDYVNGKASNYVGTLVDLKNASKDLEVVGLRDSINARQDEIDRLSSVKSKDGAARVIRNLVDPIGVGTPTISGSGGHVIERDSNLDPRLVKLIRDNSDDRGNLNKDANFVEIRNQIDKVISELSASGRDRDQGYKDAQLLREQVTRLAAPQNQNLNDQRLVDRAEFQTTPLYREFESKVNDIETRISLARTKYNSADPQEKELLRKELGGLLEEARSAKAGAEFAFLDKYLNSGQQPGDPNTYNELYAGSQLQTEVFPRLITSLTGFTELTETELRTIDEYNSLKSKQYDQEISTLKRITDERSTYGEIAANRDKALQALEAQKQLALADSTKKLEERNASDREKGLERAVIEADFNDKAISLAKSFDDLIVPLESRLIPAIERAAIKLDETIAKIDETYNKAVATADDRLQNAKARKESLNNGPNKGRANTALNYLADKEIEKAEIQRLELLVKAAESKQTALVAAKVEAEAIQATAQADLDRIDAILKRAEAGDSTLIPEEVSEAQDKLSASQARLADATKKVNVLNKETAVLQDEITDGYRDIATASGTIVQPTLTASQRLKPYSRNIKKS